MIKHKNIFFSLIAFNVGIIGQVTLHLEIQGSSSVAILGCCHLQRSHCGKTTGMKTACGLLGADLSLLHAFGWPELTMWLHPAAKGWKKFSSISRGSKTHGELMAQDFIHLFFFFFYFRAAAEAYGGSWASGRIRTAATSLHHSHSHAESKQCL